MQTKDGDQLLRNAHRMAKTKFFILFIAFVFMQIFVLFLERRIVPLTTKQDSALQCLKQNQRIPKIVHFIFVNDESFSMFLFQHIAIKAANKILWDHEVWLHYCHEPSGEYWHKSIPFIHKLIKHPNITEIYEKPVDVKAHKADILRLQILFEYGGIYLDTDVIVNKRFPEELYEERVILAIQNGWEAKTICNSFIMAEPKAKFIQLWLNEYKNGFDDNCWDCHSLIIPTSMIPEYPGLTNLLPKSDKWFNVDKTFNATRDVNSFYIQHLWHSFFLANGFERDTEEKIRGTVNESPNVYKDLMLRYIDWKDDRDGPKYAKKSN